MADQQDRLRTGPQRLLEPLLARDVEVVVGLVEQQDVGVGAQQHLEGETLLLAARERGQRPFARHRQRLAHRDGAARVPQHLGVPPARVAPHGVGAGEGHARCARRGQPRQRPRRRPARTAARCSRGPATGRASMSRTVRPSSRQPTSWRMTRRRPSTCTLPPCRGHVAGDDAEQRRLADAVGAHERHVLAVTDAEADVATGGRRRPASGTPPRSRRWRPRPGRYRRSADAPARPPATAARLRRAPQAECGAGVRRGFMPPTARSVDVRRTPARAWHRPSELVPTPFGVASGGHASRGAAGDPGRRSPSPTRSSGPSGPGCACWSASPMTMIEPAPRSWPTSSGTCGSSTTRTGS